jgi:hypothetical protein
VPGKHFFSITILLLAICHILAVDSFADDLQIMTHPTDGPYISSEGIVAGEECVILPNQKVFFGASTQIRLLPGFNARAGSFFSALIGDFSDVTPTSDSDNDGEYDWWELAVFSTTNLSATSDTDGDGVTDFIEIKMDTDPRDPSDTPSGRLRFEYDELGRIKKIMRF